MLSPFFCHVTIVICLISVIVTLRQCCRSVLEIVMAAGDVKVDLSAIERQWIVVALQNQRSVLVRARAKEFAGSEIWVLRGREIDQVSALLARFQ